MREKKNGRPPEPERVLLILCAFSFPRIDNYEWCGSSTYATSGWEEITNDFSGIQVASYMSEYGFVTFLSFLLAWCDIRSDTFPLKQLYH